MDQNNPHRPFWVLSGTTKRSARAALALYTCAVLVLLLAGFTDSFSRVWLELIIATTCTVWAYAQWRYITSTTKQIDFELKRLLREEASRHDHPPEL